MGFGDRIKEYRKLLKISQKELAERAGISLMSVRRYEANEREPRREVLDRIADAVNVDSSELYPPFTLHHSKIHAMLDAIVVDETVDPEWAQLHEKFKSGTITHEELKRYVGIIQQTANGAGARMNKAMTLLNHEGQEEAVKRVEELTEIPKYQLTPGKSVITASEPTEADHHVTTAPDSETPSESKETPPQDDAQVGERADETDTP